MYLFYPGHRTYKLHTWLRPKLILSSHPSPSTYKLHTWLSNLSWLLISVSAHENCIYTYLLKLVLLAYCTILVQPPPMLYCPRPTLIHARLTHEVAPCCITLAPPPCSCLRCVTGAMPHPCCHARTYCTFPCRHIVRYTCTATLQQCACVRCYVVSLLRRLTQCRSTHPHGWAHHEGTEGRPEGWRAACEEMVSIRASMMREMKCWCFILPTALLVLKYKGSRVQNLYQNARYSESSILSLLCLFW